MVAAISPVNTSVQNPQFKGRTKIKSVEQYPDYKVVTMETEASTGKKWGVGIASACVAGLGQCINGQLGKAAGFFFGTIAASVLGFVLGGDKAKGLALSYIMAGAVGIWSIVDAVKNASTETTQIIPNKKNSANINVSA